MEPTEAGEIYLARVAPLPEELERAAEEVPSDPVQPPGLLRHSTSVAFGQRVIVPQLAALRPPKLGLKGSR